LRLSIWMWKWMTQPTAAGVDRSEVTAIRYRLLFLNARLANINQNHLIENKGMQALMCANRLMKT